VIAYSRNLNLSLESPKQISSSKELKGFYLRLLKEKIKVPCKNIYKSKHLNNSYFKIVTNEKDVDKINKFSRKNSNKFKKISK
jgi:hypothetical protein